MKNKFTAVFLTLFILPAAFGNVFEHEGGISAIINELPEIESINCRFSQEKQVSNMVLNSSGDFSFDKNRGAVFYTTRPVKSTSSYTSAEYRQINRIVSAINSKSYSRLEKEFKFYFEKNGGCWSLGLIPLEESAAYNYLKSLEIEGSEGIDKIVILTCDKTKTTIRFEK